MVVHVRGGRVADIEPVGCDVVRFDVAQLDIAGVADLAVLRGRLTRRRPGSARRGRGPVARSPGPLVGKGELHHDLRRPGSLPDLLVALREDFDDDEPFCWWDSIDDRSRPAIDVDEVRSGSDFAADLVALADELSHKLADEDGALADLADELSDGLPGALRQQRTLERLLDSASAPAGELVDRALAVALAALDGGGR